VRNEFSRACDGGAPQLRGLAGKAIGTRRFVRRVAKAPRFCGDVPNSARNAGPTPMDLQFWPGAVTMVMISTVTASFITVSGRSAWFIGALMILIYAVFALTLYVVPPPGQG